MKLNLQKSLFCSIESILFLEILVPVESSLVRKVQRGRLETFFVDAFDKSCQSLFF